MGSLIMGPRYEATAFLEFSESSDLATAEAQLSFPSLFRVAAGSDEAAADLSHRSRAKVRKGSRLIAITVAHSEPASAAQEADRLAEAYLATLAPNAENPPDPVKSSALPDPSAADSPQSLLEAWRAQSAEFEKLSGRYNHDEAHPAVTGARQRLKEMADRISKQVADLRRQVGLPTMTPEEATLAPDGQIARLLSAVEGAEKPRAARPVSPVPAFHAVLAERATVPSEPVSPSRLVTALLGAAMGGCLAMLWIGCCGCGPSSCASPKSAA